MLDTEVAWAQVERLAAEWHGKLRIQIHVTDEVEVGLVSLLGHGLVGHATAPTFPLAFNAAVAQMEKRFNG